MKVKRMSMFWNWIRWNCLNKENWNGEEIPIGTIIDEDQFSIQIMNAPKRKPTTSVVG